MIPARQGHRDAAQGTPARDTNPEYAAAYNAVETHRAAGLDSLGHAPSMPHLCRRATRANLAVCNCCERCEVLCFVEPYREKAQRIFDVPMRTIDGLLKIWRGR